jgi:hypothetical protein
MKKDTHTNYGNSALLDSLPKLNCFRVPDGYFDRLHQAIALKVQMEGLPFDDALNQLKQAQPFALPDNYFDSLADKIAAKTQPFELPEKDGYAVPQGYFETLYVKVADRVAEENNPATVWWQNAGVVLRPALAIAAVVTIAIFIALPYVNNNGGNTTASNQPATNNTINTPNTNKDNNIVTPPVVAETAKKATNKRVSTQKSVVIVTSNDEAAELLDYTYDFSTDGLLSEVPEKINTDDNSLVEILAEGNLDLADLVDGM